MYKLQLHEKIDFLVSLKNRQNSVYLIVIRFVTLQFDEKKNDKQITSAKQRNF